MSSWNDPLLQASDGHEESFWPSFTDIMMVIMMVFLLVTVTVVLSNTRLLKDLRNSIAAQEQASELAQHTLKENATLEEQLDYFQRQLSSTELELLRSRAQAEQVTTDLESTRVELSLAQAQVLDRTAALEKRGAEVQTLQADLTAQTTETERVQTELQQTQRTLATETSRLETELQQTKQEQATETGRLRTELQQVQADLVSSRAEATEKDDALTALREKVEADRQQLLSLEGNYAELDKKYQKLLKPTRSDKGKTVVEVMYQRSGYSIRKPGEATYRTVGAGELDSELGGLKATHGTDLYVKIIIPENSGLSYNQAWAFTRDTLGKYDYYYQEDTSRPVEEPAGE